MHHTSSNKTLKFYYALEWAEACPIIHLIHKLLVLVYLSHTTGLLQGSIYSA
jgi:hypothetical protein